MAGTKSAGIDWREFALALALGAAGGALFRAVGVPLPWLLGAMTFNTIAAMAGARVAIPRHVRSGFLTVLGVLLGAGFTPAVLSRLQDWLLTVSALAVWALLAGAVAYVYLRRAAKLDPITAFFGSAPGGLAEMTAVGGQMGADIPKLALTQSVRVMFVVLIVPIWFRLEGLIAPEAPQHLVGLADVSLRDYAILAACAVVGGLLGTRLRLPAAAMMGPMLCSTAVHLAGFTDSQPPYVVTAAAQVVLGAAIGQRFSGTAIRTVAVTAAHAVVATVLMLLLAVAFAAGVAPFTGQSFAALVLAFAPGGFAEMSLVALALSVDAAFVASHHLIRIMFVITLAPLIFRRTRGRPPNSPSA